VESLRSHAVRASPEVLSIGAGGEVTDILNEEGVSFTSVDIDPAMNPDIVMDITDMAPIPDGSVDVIICMEVLEHVHNPFMAIGEMRRVLKDGGLFIGSTPFMLGHHLHPHDYFRFTLFGLRHLFRDYEEVTLVTRNSYMQAVNALIMRLYASSTRSSKATVILLSPLILAAIGILAVTDRFVRCNDATTGFFFVWRKPAAK
jgi:SAM-dependent methyltransferase